MNKSSAINVLTSVPTKAAKSGIKFSELGILKQNDKNVQCNLLQTPIYSELRNFTIEDKNERKFLLRAIFGWIILQHVFYLPFMYLCINDVSSRVSENFENCEILCGIYLIISGLFYYFRNFRRSMMHSYLSLVFVTIVNIISMGIYANGVNSFAVLLQPIILIIQLSGILLFTLQSKFDLTYFGALIILIAIFLIFLISNIFIIHNGELYMIGILTLFTAVYICFDTQLMLTSPLHGYNMTAKEHVFGAVNLFADVSKLAWLLFGFVFLDSSILACRIILKTITSKLY